MGTLKLDSSLLCAHTYTPLPLFPSRVSRIRTLAIPYDDCRARANISALYMLSSCARKSTNRLLYRYCRCYFEGASCKYRPKVERRRGVRVRNALFRDTRQAERSGRKRTRMGGTAPSLQNEPAPKSKSV